MMKANELRTGNWVCVDNDSDLITVVDGITLDAVHLVGNAVNNRYEQVFPIQLTEDWILNLGFEETYNSNYTQRFDLMATMNHGYIFGINIDKKLNTLSFRFWGKEIGVKYVHEVQNLYFVLSGNELTYKV